MTESQRNLLILVGVAVLGVVFSGAFGIGASAAGGLLNIAFTVVIIAAVIMLYRRHSGTIAQMPTTPRLVMQSSVILLGGILVTGTLTLGGLLPYPPFGWSNRYPLPFWGSIFALGFAIWWSWQQRTSRW